MATQLVEPLEVGQEYYVMFYTSMYDGGEKIINWCATNHIGLRFFQDPDYDNSVNAFNPDNLAHLDYLQVLTDTSSWTKVEGFFTPEEPFNWVAIGNFFTDENTELEILNSNGTCSGIYYIENICVGLSPADCDYLVGVQDHQIEKSIKIFPNPTTDYISIQIDHETTFSYNFYSMYGDQILPPQSVIGFSEKINISHLSTGIYILSIHMDEQTVNYKIVKQ